MKKYFFIKSILISLPRKTRKSLKERNLKFNKANNILSELLTKFKNSSELRKKLKNPFNSCLTAEDLMKKIHGDENKLIGILIGYKFFKPLSKHNLKKVNKMLKVVTSKKKKEEDETHLNQFHSTIAGLESKIQCSNNFLLN